MSETSTTLSERVTNVLIDAGFVDRADWREILRLVDSEVERLAAEVKTQNGWAHDVMRERDRYREALELIAQHARLDVAERGKGECERYAGIAEHALEGAPMRQEERHG